jgi:hypothetical protein
LVEVGVDEEVKLRVGGLYVKESKSFSNLYYACCIVNQNINIIGSLFGLLAGVE